MNNNILVQYQGGGYDGCFWEWNFFYIDKDGEFHDIFSSGRDGITNKDDGQNLIDEDTDHVYIYDMTSEEDIKTFNAECNVVHITGVLQWFEAYNSPDIEFFAVCSECGCRVTECSEIALENWHGCGGIMSTADVLLCQECRSSGTCDCCGEYVGQKELIYLGGEYDFDDDYKNKAARKMLDDGYSDVCEGCIDYQASQIEQDEHEDLLFQSLATGKPDLFSGEMEWFWL